MAAITKTEFQGQAHSPKGIKGRYLEAVAAWLMASPAVILLLAFLIIPFFLAFYYAFTNQRLVSPNPTEYVDVRQPLCEG